ncbi:ankyrin repeat-containing domain protein [Aspergillus caelatus]|uniref:Ankyrin repeat-containing domain protein n=1 Tax=Aspergillus caelatus TaxID=61420 RepID=A0A5N7APS1_9EURO|nr:ankyrin repeat-containing domain protein [Aspergillus caelatus]KAE8370720.1 ankyrin repeat-containing domain protein [Aspergillus caelatus]
MTTQKLTFPSFPGDLPPILLQITPQPTEPLVQQCQLEPVKHLAVSGVHRTSRRNISPARKRYLSSTHEDQIVSNVIRRHSSAIPSHHSCSPLDQSTPFNGGAKSLEGKTTLHICAKGYTTMLQFLLDHGAEIDATNFVGRTALYYATRGHTDSVSVFLEQGADTELTDEFGQTPLHIAVELGYEAVARPLIREGADINALIASGIQQQS